MGGIEGGGQVAIGVESEYNIDRARTGLKEKEGRPSWKTGSYSKPVTSIFSSFNKARCHCTIGWESLYVIFHHLSYPSESGQSSRRDRIASGRGDTKPAISNRSIAEHVLIATMASTRSSSLLMSVSVA